MGIGLGGKLSVKQRVILITGAAGFVGSHMVEHLLKNTEDRIIGIDCLNYSGTWDRLRDVRILPGVMAFEHPRFTPMVHDFRQPAEPNLLRELKDVTHIIHMGAESHVDSSITDPLKFCISNVEGTVNMLNLARQLKNLELFVYFSTDEVFGPAPFEMKDGYKENDRHDPKNPYAASKSAAEQFVVSFANTYNLPCIITRQMNVFGERQHPEKFIPLCIRKILLGEKVTIHATPDKLQAGLRHYIHGRNVADAHLFLLNEKPWLNKSVREVESYHISGELEVDNLTLAKTIAEIVGKPLDYEMVDFHSSRQGHDLRYALDYHKMKGIGWTPPKTFHQSLKTVVDWTLNNKRWIGLE